MAPLPRPLPQGGFTFSISPSATHLNHPVSHFLSTPLQFQGSASTSTHIRPQAIAGGALIFSKSAPDAKDRILLLQRAPHDSMPLRWEIPGGACDPEDESFLHGVAREMWEEAGLLPKRMVCQVGGQAKPQVFLTRSGKVVMKISVEVDIDEGSDAEEKMDGNVDGKWKSLPKVVMDPNEHVRFVWATEEECKAERMMVEGEGGETEELKLNFTHKEQRETILEGFEIRRRRALEGKDVEDA
ncbi:hypothetical protein GE21DRAFT_3811 [Neurospora crassa]|uniref:Nudix hydrolase domain-containing protein n=1 Tax=Neurospora crassa (strain ATCC 24698 / 74-OR23-1A / CBS 708.71 / DSM 1257 / FGSC 987) TaxID=367110 RepID=Q7S0Z0_NEUCR|nr:hypothetical protein NCU09154 [Neurospora crassa OR74A]EAA29010.1 hypothetical protein NCU09154 [Neurospora crassa OR74A]KHE84369.1 hypothetical protein GE21DRAFT_3811 [Neurospora crassa]|eukprot:XP_958246.1 hypothetical protein NCU09154 [Neurospora crassa OR74A]